MKNLYSLLLLILMLNQGNSQSFSWAKDYDSSGPDTGDDLVIDEFDNIYTIGSFSNSINFGSDSNSSLSSKGRQDIFLNKLDDSGKLLWSKNIGGKGNDYAKRILFDKQSNLLIGGNFGNGPVDFDPGSNEHILENDANLDQFILKLDKEGRFLWVNQVVNGQLEDLATDEEGNVYTAGNFQGEMSFVINGELQAISAIDRADSYIQKIDPNGNTIWVKILGGNELEAIKSIKLDLDGNIYCTGVFTETTDFDPSAEIFELESKGEYDIFLLKINSEGEFLWAKGIGSPSYDLAPLVEVRLDNKIYLTGRLGGESFMSLIDSSGKEIWNKILIGPTDFYYVGFDNILLGNNNHYFVTGAFIGSIDFDPSDKSTVLSTNTSKDGEADCFVAAYNKEGALIWAKQISGKEAESGNALALDSYSDLIMLGNFNRTLEINAENFSFYSDATNNENDIFLVKILTPEN